MCVNYLPADIKKKWQDFWDARRSFEPSDDFEKPKICLLSIFPYPAGDSK